MQRDPYEILGVHRNSTEEEIKKAYRDLAKKYHPDNYSDPNMAELAGEKMKEVNEAYEYIKNDLLNGRTGGENSYTGSVYAEVRYLINMRNYSEADVKLEAISSTERGAEWHFLKGCLLTQRGWFLDAQKYFETACRMDPQNQEYRQAADSLRNSANGYTNTWTTDNEKRNNNCDCCDCGDCCIGCDCCPSCSDIFCCLSIDCCCDALGNGC